MYRSFIGLIGIFCISSLGLAIYYAFKAEWKDAGVLLGIAVIIYFIGKIIDRVTHSKEYK